MSSFDLIATDLDGTFLDDRKQIPELNARAIATAAQRGITTVFASGRPLRWFNRIADLDTCPGLAVAANGAVIFDIPSRQIKHFHPMDRDHVLSMAQDIRDRLPDALFAAEYLTDWATEPGFSRFVMDSDSDFCAPLDELFSHGPVTKLLMIEPHTPTDELAHLAQPLIGDQMTMTFSYLSDVGMLELSAPGITKARALTEILTDLRLTPDRMIAFGDMPNDLAMLKLAGQGYAMQECHASLIEAGYPIAGDNNSGAVGRTILRLLDEF